MKVLILFCGLMGWICFGLFNLARLPLVAEVPAKCAVRQVEAKPTHDEISGTLTLENGGLVTNGGVIVVAGDAICCSLTIAEMGNNEHVAMELFDGSDSVYTLEYGGKVTLAKDWNAIRAQRCIEALVSRSKPEDYAKACDK